MADPSFASRQMQYYDATMIHETRRIVDSKQAAMMGYDFDGRDELA